MSSSHGLHVELFFSSNPFTRLAAASIESLGTYQNLKHVCPKCHPRGSAAEEGMLFVKRLRLTDFLFPLPPPSWRNHTTIQAFFPRISAVTRRHDDGRNERKRHKSLTRPFSTSAVTPPTPPRQGAPRRCCRFSASLASPVPATGSSTGARPRRRK